MIYQLLYYIGAMVVLPLSPVLILLGKRVRATVPSLPEAEGPNQGTEGREDPPLHLLLLGESTMAGVGVRTHKEGFAGALARYLQRAVGKKIQWQVLAKSGYTAREVRQHLAPRLPAEPMDVIVIGLGGNDTFRLNTPLRWRSNMIHLIRVIREKQPGAAIVINNLPPVGQFPAFPPPLQLVLGALVRLHGRAIRNVPSLFDEVYYRSRPISLEEWRHKIPDSTSPEAFFSDGVHPSKLTYRLWAEETGAFMVRKGLLK